MTEAMVATATAVQARMDSSRIMGIVRMVLDSIVALQPMDGRATLTGTMLLIRQLDGSAVAYSYQHVAGGTLRVVRTTLEGLVTVDTVVTPLDTERVALDHVRALAVEVLR